MNINSNAEETTNIKEFASGSPLTVLHVSNSFIKTSRVASLPVNGRKSITAPSYKYEPEKIDVCRCSSFGELIIIDIDQSLVPLEVSVLLFLIKMRISAKTHFVLDLHLLQHIAT
jgi:hypothetical protein